MSGTDHGDRERPGCKCGCVSSKETPDTRNVTNIDMLKSKDDNQARKRQRQKEANTANKCNTQEEDGMLEREAAINESQTVYREGQANQTRGAEERIKPQDEQVCDDDNSRSIEHSTSIVQYMFQSRVMIP